MNFTQFTIINLPKDLHDKAKSFAKNTRRVSLSNFIIEALREKLEREAPDAGR